MFAGRRTELPAQLQPDNRHHEAHEPEQGHRQDNRIAHRSERESDRKVVQAQRSAADEQPPPVPDLRRIFAAPQCLDESPDRGREQYPGAGPAGGGPQRASETGADEHPSGRHHDVAQAEDRSHLHLGPPVHAAHPDSDRRTEVVQPKRDRHDEKRNHHQIKQHTRGPRQRNLPSRAGMCSDRPVLLSRRTASGGAAWCCCHPSSASPPGGNNDRRPAEFIIIPNGPYLRVSSLSLHEVFASADCFGMRASKNAFEPCKSLLKQWNCFAWTTRMLMGHCPTACRSVSRRQGISADHRLRMVLSKRLSPLSQDSFEQWDVGVILAAAGQPNRHRHGPTLGRALAADQRI